MVLILIVIVIVIDMCDLIVFWKGSININKILVLGMDLFFKFLVVFFCFVDDGIFFGGDIFFIFYLYFVYFIVKRKFLCIRGVIWMCIICWINF